MALGTEFLVLIERECNLAFLSVCSSYSIGRVGGLRCGMVFLYAVNVLLSLVDK